MKKVLFVIALVVILVFAGCTAATVSERDGKSPSTASTEPVVQASEDIVTESDSVEIGEML